MDMDSDQPHWHPDQRPSQSGHGSATYSYPEPDDWDNHMSEGMASQPYFGHARLEPVEQPQVFTQEIPNTDDLEFLNSGPLQFRPLLLGGKLDFTASQFELALLNMIAAQTAYQTRHTSHEFQQHQQLDETRLNEICEFFNQKLEIISHESSQAPHCSDCRSGQQPDIAALLAEHGRQILQLRKDIASHKQSSQAEQQAHYDSIKQIVHGIGQERHNQQARIILAVEAIGKAIKGVNLPERPHEKAHSVRVRLKKHEDVTRIKAYSNERLARKLDRGSTEAMCIASLNLEGHVLHINLKSEHAASAWRGKDFGPSLGLEEGSFEVLQDLYWVVALGHELDEDEKRNAMKNKERWGRENGVVFAKARYSQGQLVLALESKEQALALCRVHVHLSVHPGFVK